MEWVGSERVTLRPVKNNITKILAKHLHPDSVYRDIVKHYGSMVGINADVYGFGVHALRATAATNALAHNTDIAKPEFEDRRYTPKERIESQLLIHSGSCIYVHTHVLYQTWIASIE